MKGYIEKIKNFLIDSSLFVLVYKGLEELIARVTLIAVSNIFSILFCVTFTQCVQVILKKFFKMFISKKEVDEVQFIKDSFKFIWFNKWTIYMCLCSVFTGYCAYQIIPLPQWANILIASVILILGICGSIQIGGESLDKITIRRIESKRAIMELRIKKSAEQEKKTIRKAELKMKKEKIRQMKIAKKAELKKLELDFKDKINGIMRCDDESVVNSGTDKIS